MFSISFGISGNLNIVGINVQNEFYVQMCCFLYFQAKEIRREADKMVQLGKDVCIGSTTILFKITFTNSFLPVSTFL